MSSQGGQPSYYSRIKVPIVPGHQGCQAHLVNSALVGFSQVRHQYKQRASLSIYNTLTHTYFQCIDEGEEVVGARKKEATAVERSSYCFGVLLLVLILSLRKLWGFVVLLLVLILSLRKLWVFVHLWFPQGKTLYSLSRV